MFKSTEVDVMFILNHCFRSDLSHGLFDSIKMCTDSLADVFILYRNVFTG